VSDTQLITLSTLAWLIGTVTLFILLAHWSAGGSWGISTAVAHGLTSWAGRGGDAERISSSSADLRPMAPPQLERLWGADRRHSPERAGRSLADVAVAEFEDLGSRRLAR
jgi:hypothetical protein